MIRIKKARSNFEREPLLSPFGFKGGYLSELWQSVVLLESESGCRGIGLGTQSVLWSDPHIFTENSEAAGNSLMYLMTAHALQAARDIPFKTPIDLLDALLPVTYKYGQKITGNSNLCLTFALNSLVAVDNAAWQLYSAAKKIKSFNDMLPKEMGSALSHRHQKLACIPLISYGVSLGEIVKAVEDGYFFLKIKIGSDPGKDGDREKMLQWDMKRVEEIHKAVGSKEVPYTKNGKIAYYFDANGRYDSKERLQRFLDYTKKIGAFEQIIIVEEPFPEEYEVDVDDLGVRIAADESAHSDKDAKKRIEMGYGAMALKPIAKTLSMTLKILKTAYEANIPCFCADLTVNPILVDWNKNVAARLAPLPGMNIGVLETNGHQNYKRWDELLKFHPCYGAEWMKRIKGVFNLDEDFYVKNGGIFQISEHYEDLVTR